MDVLKICICTGGRVKRTEMVKMRKDEGETMFRVFKIICFLKETGHILKHLILWQTIDAIKNSDFYYMSFWKRVFLRQITPSLFISSLT
jgi:hypothetical protein